VEGPAVSLWRYSLTLEAPHFIYRNVLAGLRNPLPGLKAGAGQTPPQLKRAFIARGQHRLKKRRLSLFMHHGGVHIPESGLAQQQLQFHLSEA
jgi:hypothetical protein